jgi:hypothetical protein
VNYWRETLTDAQRGVSVESLMAGSGGIEHSTGDKSRRFFSQKGVKRTQETATLGWSQSSMSAMRHFPE